MRKIRGIVWNIGEAENEIEAIRKDAREHQYEVELARTHKCKVLLIDSSLWNWIRAQFIIRKIEKQTEA